MPKGRTGGKSELHRAGCRITSGESDLRESATEMLTADGALAHRQGCNGAVRAHQQPGDGLAR